MPWTEKRATRRNPRCMLLSRFWTSGSHPTLGFVLKLKNQAGIHAGNLTGRDCSGGLITWLLSARTCTMFCRSVFISLNIITLTYLLNLWMHKKSNIVFWMPSHGFMLCRFWRSSITFLVQNLKVWPVTQKASMMCCAEWTVWYCPLRVSVLILSTSVRWTDGKLSCRTSTLKFRWV